MNPSLKKLYQISTLDYRLIVGLMSGTSQDGVDLVLCRIKGDGRETEAEILQFDTVSYPVTVKEELQKAAYKKTADLQMITLLHAQLGNFYGKVVADFVNNHYEESSNVDLIASHGQTVFHAPKSLHKQKYWPNATLQLGDGDRIARATGIITISDFRQKEIAAGGEGAPLAGYAEWLLYGGTNRPRILINIGGISNCTLLNTKVTADQIITTDLGPGNTLIDEAVRRYYPDLDYDTGGKIAASGAVSTPLLDQLLLHPFLSMKFPKSTGQESFNMTVVDQAVEKIGEIPDPSDLIATLTQFTAEAIARSVKKLIQQEQIPSPQIIVSGGGVYNTTLIKGVKNLLDPLEFVTSEKIGVDPSAKEALLMAVLANETVCGKGFAGKGENTFTMGKISLPV